MSTKKKQSNKKRNAPKMHKHWRFLKWTLGILGTISLLILALFLSFRLSPWPGALLIRYEFEKGGRKTAQALEKHVPSGVVSIQNQQYRSNDKDAQLDVFYPEQSSRALPTVVWVHGGAWVSGSKDDVDNYLKILAARGFTTVGVNYSIAPEKKYPTPILQVNDALGYLQRHAARLHIDPNNVVLAGDSAGSQIVAQVATIITNPAYAKDINIAPQLVPEKLKGMVLNCGAYDLRLPNYNEGLAGWFLHTVLWAYSGKKDFLHDPALKHANVVDYVTTDFPPTFLTAGNVDPLEDQSTEMAKKLSSLGIPTTTLFYPANHVPALPHEYQFNLDIDDGRRAFEQIADFISKNTQN